jgi:acetyl esterase/lipase
MKLQNLAGVLALLIAQPAAAQTPLVDPEIAALTVRADVFPMPSASFPGGIVAKPDVEFSNLMGFRPLLLDLYMHEDAATAPARPLVIWIHGGGWSRGDGRTSGAFADFPAVLASLAARGYVVASVNYRLTGEARFPAQVQDVKAAVRHLRREAGKYGIDPTRVYLWGGSAGGHLATLAATTCGLAEFEPEASTGRLSRTAAKSAAPDVSDCVQAVVSWYGLYEVSGYKSPNVPALLGCAPAACPAVAAKASPITHAGPSSPPMLLIHGSADQTAPPAQMTAMGERLRAAKAPVETLMIPGVDHGWMGSDAASTRDASRLALNRTFEFFDAQAGRKP